jgi:hypothetical protein
MILQAVQPAQRHGEHVRRNAVRVVPERRLPDVEGDADVEPKARRQTVGHADQPTA